ncbi:uncharacterized protein LOC125819421 [Solanum verrucosum]|uniref:uncharacterized protein LOC125819421 n=1 Tax=Solanum verrucosum TaxID=315347 RepID=UPI0020D01C62|nr:uncharacterized protein LOC125819421 [Solanum verrucosum]
MDRANPLLGVLFCLLYGLVYQVTLYLFPLPFHFLEFFKIQYVQKVMTYILLLIPPCLMLACSIRYKNKLSNHVIHFLISGKNDITFDCISSWFQVGRHLFYKEDLALVVFISNVFFISIIFLDQFVQREDIDRTKAIMLVKKIVKRCIYGFFLILYLGRMLKTDYLPFPLPGCIIPLIPAIMGGCLIVFCYNDEDLAPMIPVDLSQVDQRRDEPVNEIRDEPVNEIWADEIRVNQSQVNLRRVNQIRDEPVNEIRADEIPVDYEKRPHEE